MRAIMNTPSVPDTRGRMVEADVWNSLWYMVEPFYSTWAENERLSPIADVVGGNTMKGHGRYAAHIMIIVVESEER